MTFPLPERDYPRRLRCRWRTAAPLTLSIAGPRREPSRDCDDAVVIFSRKLLKYTNSRVRRGPAHGAAGGLLDHLDAAR